MRNNTDDDVGGEKSQTVIDDEEIVQEEADEPIVEERVFDSSCAAVSETAGLSEPSVMPSFNDRCEMNNETSAGAKSGYIKTLNEDVEVLIPTTETKKSKNRKLRKMSDAGPSEPKQKLTREDKEAKKARRAERRARKAARRAQRAAKAHDTMEKEVEENVVEEEVEVIPPVLHTSVDDEWLPEQEQQVNDPDEDSDDEDVLLQEEIRYLNGVIQSSMARKYVFEACLKCLTGEEDVDVGGAAA
ncbi:hypothetical protein LIER_23837 [Lithospermum erythrorhizon]|uniref:Uncharacterized protein n=1 Tax=Lithospermum erythrorhizon TaxID=34254 RepID=A0AAV3R1U9_LITER